MTRTEVIDKLVEGVLAASKRSTVKHDPLSREFVFQTRRFLDDVIDRLVDLAVSEDRILHWMDQEGLSKLSPAQFEMLMREFV